MSRSTVSETEASATKASTATTNATDGRKESSKSMSKSVRVELKGVGVSFDWLLRLLSGFTECWSCHWQCLQSKRRGVLNIG